MTTDALIASAGMPPKRVSQPSGRLARQGDPVPPSDTA